MIKKIKKFFILFFFCCFVTLMGAEREIPHTIVKENPEKEVTEIQTLKKYKEKAELNITVTKIKTEELPVQVDRNRKKIFAKLENVEGEEIQAVEKPEDIPDPETVEGRKALNKNRSRRGKRSISDSNLETERYDITAGEKRTKLEINYRNLPKDLYIAVTDKNTRKLKKLYKANYADYRATYDKSVNVKLWLFGEEVEALSNVVLDYSNNGTGNIALRSNGQYSSPEDVIIKSGLHTAFNMDKELVNEEFEDNDTIKIENEGGEVSSIKSNQGNFYTTGNKYGELKIPGFKVKARIWSNCPKLELSLQKDGKGDGYARFDIVHRDSKNRTRQTIHVEIFVNNKPFKEYFKTDAKAYRQEINSYPPYQDIRGWKELNDPGIEVKGFYTDSLEIYKKNDAEIERIFGEAPYEPPVKFQFNNGGALGFYPNVTNADAYMNNHKVDDFKINQIMVSLAYYWLYQKYQTYQIFILRDALQFRYASGKREIPVELNFGFFTQDWQESNQDIIGKMVGIPIVGENLTKFMYNGGKVVDFDYNKEAFVVHRSMITPNKRILIEAEGGIVLADCYDSQDLDKTTFKYEGVEFRINRVKLGEVEDPDYRHYYFSIEKMNLTNSERVLRISGSSTDGNKYNKTTNIIKIPKFSPKSLINNDNTSLKEEVIRYVDVSDSNISSSLFINLGEFHFKYYKDMTVLRTNMSESPYIKLPESAYLTLESDPSVKIPVTLSFNKVSSERKLTMDNFENGSPISGGGNGKVVYLNISPENYKELKKQGGGVTYTLVADIKIKTNINKTPISGQPTVGMQDENLKVNVKIKTIEATANKATIEFQEKKPLFKDGFFKFLGSQVIPETEKVKGPIYANTVKLKGEVPEVKGTGKEHRYELIDGDGGVHRGIIRKGGTGGYWESVDIGNNSRASISQGKGGVTYIALTGWNYGGSNGTVSIKHYEGNSENISQYYIFNFIVPKFDPYIYYNENGDSRIKKFEKKEVNFPESGEKNILLGEIVTQDYDMEITKDGRDSEGLRIEGNTSVDILYADTGISTGKKAKIILEGTSVQTNKIIGKNKTAKVYLEFPDSLSDRTKEYIVKSSYESKEEMNGRQGYILRIGRNDYFKELIKEIKISGKKELVKGRATINITTDYNSKDSGILKPSANPSTEKLSFENEVKGMILTDASGNGFIKLESTDKLEISVNGSTSVEVLKDKVGEISLTKNKMKVEIKNNKVHISFPIVQLGESEESSFKLKVIDSTGKEKGEYDFKVVFPKNYLRIISVENMDFGQAAPGMLGYKASGKVHIETLNTVEKRNLKVEKNQEQVELIRESSFTDKLVAKMIGETLEKEGTMPNGKYMYEVIGELDVPENTTIGNYKGTLQITVSIKE